VVVTLTTVDNGSGVDEVYYAIDGTPSVGSPTYEPASKPVLHDGQTISYFSVDEVGNTSATKTSVAAQVDKAAPSVSDDVPSAVVSHDVTVTLTASDPDSGVDKTRYAIDGTPTGSSPIYDPASKPVLQDGQTISYFSVDKVGNTSATRTSAAAKVEPSPGESPPTGPTPAATLCSGQSATIIAVPGQVTTGTSGHDVIVGTAGADTINAGGGDDLVCAGGGDDTVDGGAGNDRVRGQGGDDTLAGGSGVDRLSSGDGDDVLTGGVGDDQIAGRDGDDRLGGEAGNDHLSGGAGDDSLHGGPGDDVLAGGPGKDRLVGRAGEGTPAARERH
jgi:Ca2+-binding RTX toxin-like protein